MLEHAFDGELRGSDGTVVAVHCKLKPPMVGGQRAEISLLAPTRKLRGDPPESPCTLTGREWGTSILIEDIHWRFFPEGGTDLQLKEIELFHVGRISMRSGHTSERNELRFHLGPVQYLRRELHGFGRNWPTLSEELFSLRLPGLGTTSLVAEWATTLDRSASLHTATSVAGFNVVVSVPEEGDSSVARYEAALLESLDVLSVLFRQWTPLHGWTLTTTQGMTSKWYDVLAPRAAESAHEERGEFVERPQCFVECAERLTEAYAAADAKTKSLIKHLSRAVAPPVQSTSDQHFAFMFSAVERVADAAFKRDPNRGATSASDDTLRAAMEGLRAEVLQRNGEHAEDVAKRLGGFIATVGAGGGVKAKFASLFRLYPAMARCVHDLWPLIGTERERGLREIRHAIAHGKRVPGDVVAVACWHLGIFIERLIFVLLGLPLPEGITPGSVLLHHGAKGWDRPDRWRPLMSARDLPI